MILTHYVEQRGPGSEETSPCGADGDLDQVTPYPSEVTCPDCRAYLAGPGR